MKEETYNHDCLECPYCGYKDVDTWEIFDEIEQCIDGYECPNCSEVFVAVKTALFAYEGIVNKDGVE